MTNAEVGYLFQAIGCLLLFCLMLALAGCVVLGGIAAAGAVIGWFVTEGGEIVGAVLLAALGAPSRITQAGWVAARQAMAARRAVRERRLRIERVPIEIAETRRQIDRALERAEEGMRRVKAGQRSGWEDW